MEQATESSGVRDFDFWMGSWEQRNRRRKEWLADCDEWIEFESTSVAWPILGGLGNTDEFRTRTAHRKGGCRRAHAAKRSGNCATRPSASASDSVRISVMIASNDATSASQSCSSHATA